jgi:hypothetical protein
MLPPSGLQISNCVSLGPSCHAAEFLRTRGLTRYSLPFDWIHSHPGIVCACLEDDCAALLNRRDLDSVPIGADKSGSAPTPRRERRGLHRRFRTDAHAHIFRHHDPAVHDGDFAGLHRSADRLRRVLADTGSRTLYLHLETDAAPSEASRRLFVERAQAMFASLCARSSNLALVAIRAVPRCEPPGPSTPQARDARSLLLEERGSELLWVLEHRTATRTVVPFSRTSAQGTVEEKADVAALAATLESRFAFAIDDELPRRTAATDTARLAHGPRWLWQHPSLLRPCATATATELTRAIAVLPGGASHTPETLRVLADAEAAHARDEHMAVAAFAEAWAAAMGDAMSVKEWRRAAKRLATPSRRSPTRAALVGTLLGYQIAESRAAASPFGQ